MLKFINLEDIKLYKNWFLCHDITINDKTFGKDMQINDGELLDIFHLTSHHITLIIL